MNDSALNKTSFIPSFNGRSITSNDSFNYNLSINEDSTADQIAEVTTTILIEEVKRQIKQNTGKTISKETT